MQRRFLRCYSALQLFYSPIGIRGQFLCLGKGNIFLFLISMSEYLGDDVELTCFIQTNDVLTTQAEAGLQGYSKSHLINVHSN